MIAKYAWIFQILIFTHFGINWVSINTYKWDWVYNRPNWENIGPQGNLFKKSPILLWKICPYTSTFASLHGRTKRRTDLKFGIFPFDYKGNILSKMRRKSERVMWEAFVDFIWNLLVHQVKLRIQARINILIFTELLNLSLTPLHSQYCESRKTQPRLSPFRPDISQKQNGGVAQCVRSLVYNEGFHIYGNIPASSPVFQWAEQWN